MEKASLVNIPSKILEVLIQIRVSLTQSGTVAKPPKVIIIHVLNIIVIPPHFRQGTDSVDTTSWPQRRDTLLVARRPRRGLVPAFALFSVHSPVEIPIAEVGEVVYLLALRLDCPHLAIG